jgi:hypothetical protein
MFGGVKIIENIVNLTVFFDYYSNFTYLYGFKLHFNKFYTIFYGNKKFKTHVVVAIF